MDMNFPHNGLGQGDAKQVAKDKGCDIRALLSQATTRQMGSPTYKVISQLAHGAPVKARQVEDGVREHIRYFSGARKLAPTTAFLPVSRQINGDCADIGQLSESEIYQAASANSKQVEVNSSK